jgi:predicted GNAT family acetyltransferase
MMKIELIENLKGGEFVIQESGNRMAEMGYTNAGEDKIIIDHTFVDTAFRGENIGRELVKAGVEFAREKKLRIIPLCPFAMAEFERHPEYEDVLIKS